MEFIGRLHPLVVHLPIGILLMTFLFEVLSRYRGYKKLRIAANVSLVIGSVSAMVASLSGWLLSQEDSGYDERLVQQHLIAGIATTVLSLLLLAVFFNKHLFKKAERKKVRLLSLIPLVILIFVTGHLGGSLTHGSDFLLGSVEPSKAIPVAAKSIPTTNDQVMIYDHLVQPLLQAKCYDCHSSKKQKGKLRLDSEEWILKGGKDGVVIDVNDLSGSELVRRISLPIEDEDHMPPRSKDQLSSGEIDLISRWVADGASFKITISKTKDSTFYKSLLASSDLSEKNWWPTKSAEKPDEKIIQSLQQDGIVVQRLATDNNYLLITILNQDTFPSQTWNNLTKLSDQIISFRMSKMKLTDDDWRSLTQLKNLRRLFLDHTTVSDQNLVSLNSMNQLSYLNLAETAITDAGLEKLSELKSLEQLFLFGSNITDKGVQQLKKNLSNCLIDLGNYKLPALSTDTLIYRPKNAR